LAHAAKDPILRFPRQPDQCEQRAAKELDAIDAEIAAEMEEAVKFALESPEPDPATRMDYIYL